MLSYYFKIVLPLTLLHTYLDEVPLIDVNKLFAYEVDIK